MGKTQIIRTEAGEELVVLPLRDYQALLARAGDEEAENAMTARLVAESDAALARGDDIALPEEVWEEIEAGIDPVRVMRRHRGLTQADLARLCGLSQGYIAEIEAGKKSGTPESLKAIARALGVPLDLLVD